MLRVGVELGCVDEKRTDLKDFQKIPSIFVHHNCFRPGEGEGDVKMTSSIHWVINDVIHQFQEISSVSVKKLKKFSTVWWAEVEVIQVIQSGTSWNKV